MKVTEEKLRRLNLLIDAWAAHLHEAHAGQSEYPQMRIEPEAYELRCEGCGWAYRLERTEQADERWQLVEQS